MLLSITGKEGHHSEIHHLLSSRSRMRRSYSWNNWLQLHNPDINWQTNQITLSQCPKTCFSNPALTVQGITTQRNKWNLPKKKNWQSAMDTRGDVYVSKPLLPPISTRCTQMDRDRSHAKGVSILCQSIWRTLIQAIPKVHPWDHAIDLKPDAKPYAGKAYSLDNHQKEVLRTFISKNLDKGYIRPSTSPWAAPFFFVRKKDAS